MGKCVTHTKHRAVLLTLCAAGVWLAETTHLKLPDIDSQRMQLKIKGGKDRYVPISRATLAGIAQLLEACPTVQLSVPWQDVGRALPEAAVDLMAISNLLGHSSFSTTMIYTHCRH